MTTPEWRSGDTVLGDDRLLDEIAEGVHAAGNPFFDWIFGGAEEAGAAMRGWVRRPTSEVYAGRARLLFDGGVLAGGLIGLSGAQCKAARMADAAALLARARAEARPAVLARLARTKGLFVALEDDDWYVSKLWVSRALRGRAKGYALQLARAALSPPGPGYRRRLAEAWAGNAPALRIYEHIGCTIAQRTSGPDGMDFVVIHAPPRS